MTTKKNLNIRCLKVPPSLILYLFSKNEKINKYFNVSFDMWNDARVMKDEVKSGCADLCILPSNLSASYYNQGLPMRLLSINVWGILSILSYQDNQTNWSSLKNKTISVPLKGNMPDTMLNILSKKNHLRIYNDFKVDYFETYIDAMENVVQGKNFFVVLPEPYSTLAENKGLFRQIDFQKEWGKIFNCSSRYPQAGVFISNKFSLEELTLFQSVLSDSTQEVSNNIAFSSEIGHKLFNFDINIISQSIKNTIWLNIKATEARQEIEKFFRELISHDKKLVFGGIPNKNYYAI